MWSLYGIHATYGQFQSRRPMGVRTGSIFPGPGPGGASDGGSREGSTGSFQENINMFDDIEEEEEGRFTYDVL